MIGGWDPLGRHSAAFLPQLVAECHDNWQHDTVDALPVATQATTPHSISMEQRRDTGHLLLLATAVCYERHPRSPLPCEQRHHCQSFALLLSPLHRANSHHRFTAGHPLEPSHAVPHRLRPSPPHSILRKHQGDPVQLPDQPACCIDLRPTPPPPFLSARASPP
jgi:hypothetical protein